MSQQKIRTHTICVGSVYVLYYEILLLAYSIYSVVIQHLTQGAPEFRPYYAMWRWGAAAADDYDDDNNDDGDMKMMVV